MAETTVNVVKEALRSGLHNALGDLATVRSQHAGLIAQAEALDEKIAATTATAQEFAGAYGEPYAVHGLVTEEAVDGTWRIIDAPPAPVVVTDG